MRLRNKKTGESGEIRYENHELYVDTDNGFTYWLRTIAELNEDWEDYKPAEPLIKDEKKLDTVKSFFALLGISNEIYYQSINKCFYKTDDDGITYGIDFDDDKGIDNICTGLPYTITELCGEEEE